MDDDKKAMENAATTEGEDSEAYKAAQTQYYTQKAKFEQVESLVATIGVADAQAQVDADRVNFGKPVAEWEQADIRQTIQDFTNWSVSEDAAADMMAGQNLLAQFEEDAQFTVESAKKALDKNVTDENKKAYYTELQRYEFISNELGASSPAKAKESIRKIAAAAAAAQHDLADKLGKAKDMTEVAADIEDVAKGTSDLPDLLKEARTDPLILEVLGLVA
jgi:hypothetical protein